MLSYFDVDPTGKISIASSVIMNKLYLFAATAHKNSILQAVVYDISRLERSKITHLKTFEYTKDDFLDSSEQGPLEFDFNLREAVHFTTRSKNRKDKEGPLEEHHLILSCYNNGLIFFRISSEIPITTEENDSPILELTFNYPNSGTVNIFSEKAYRNNNN